MVTENQQSHDVNFLRKNKSPNRGKSYRQGSMPPDGSTVAHKRHTQSHQGSNCGYCGSHHQPRKCPAYGVLCSKCHGKNHFAKVCRGGKYTKKLYQVETEYVDNNDDSSNYLFVRTVTDRKHSTSTEQKWQAVVNVQGKSVRFKLDTGSEANVLPIYVPNEIKSAKLEKPNLVCAFGEHQVVPLGTVTLDCTTDQVDTEQLLFFVTDSADVPLLGHKAWGKLSLVKRVYLCQPMRQPQRPSLTKYEMISEFKDVFTGVGQYQKEYNFQLIANAQGVIQPPRKMPYAIQPKVREALDGLKAQNIIADVDRSTEWVSNIMIVEKKSGALRLCLDPRPLNVAIKRERHAIPTPGDVQAHLSGLKVFTVVDMKVGYWHVKLSDESSYYCTFNSHGAGIASFECPSESLP